MALDWLVPWNPPLPLQPLPIYTSNAFVAGAVLQGNATLLNDWYLRWQPPLPPQLLPFTEPWQFVAPVNQTTLTPPLTWYSNFNPPLPLQLLPPQTKLTISPFGMTQPEAVHMQWFVPFNPPLPLQLLPPSTSVVARIPTTSAAITMTAAVGKFVLGPNPAVLQTQVEPLPFFEWDVSFSFSRLVSAFVQVVAYDPPDQIMLVVFQNGQGTTYSPVSMAQMNSLVAIVQSGADPTAYLSTLTVLDQ